MKRTIDLVKIIAIGAIASFLVGCSVDPMQEQANEEETLEMQNTKPEGAVLFSASQEEITTKTIYSEQVTDGVERIDWVKGDLITVYSADTRNQYADYSIDGSEASGSQSVATSITAAADELYWKDKGDYEFFAMYPSNAQNSDATLEENVITAVIPAEQTLYHEDMTDLLVNDKNWYIDNMNYAYMYAGSKATFEGDYSATVDLEFKPMVTTLAFAVKGASDLTDAFIINSVTISSKSTLAGTIKAEITAAEDAGDASVDYSYENTSNELTITFEKTSDNDPEFAVDSKDITTYFKVFATPNDIDGLTITLNTTDGKKKVTYNNTFKGGYKHNFTIEVPKLYDSMKFTTTSNTTEFTLPFEGTAVAKTRVHWGDDEITVVQAGENLGISHNYDAAGEYTIKIETRQLDTTKAQIPEFNFSKVSTSKDYLKSMDTPILNMGVTDYSEAFYQCSNLESVVSSLFRKNAAITDFTATFQETGIVEIPSGLFANNTDATTFESTFEYCKSLTTIPKNLFDNNLKVTTFESTFNTCESLEVVPLGLLYNILHESLTCANYRYMFAGCRNVYYFAYVFLDSEREMSILDLTNVIDIRLRNKKGIDLTAMFAQVGANVDETILAKNIVFDPSYFNPAIYKDKEDEDGDGDGDDDSEENEPMAYWEEELPVYTKKATGTHQTDIKEVGEFSNKHALAFYGDEIYQ